MYTPELEAQIGIWRSKAADGTITRDELKEAIIALRQGRVSASIASATSRANTAKAAAGKKAPNLDADDLLSELGDL